MVYANCVRKLKPSADEKPRDVDTRVWEETGRILNAALAKGMTVKALSSAAGRKNTSTWDGWRNGSREPRFLEMCEFAQPVELSVRAIRQDVAVAPDGAVLTSGAGGDSVQDEATSELLQLWNELPDVERGRVLQRIEDRVKALRSSAANPTEPTAEEGQPRGRRKASSGHPQK